MKQIINGKSYNTESATQIAEDYEQALYATDKAAWFLEYKAGAFSPWGPDGGLRPLTEDEAMEWLEQRHKTEELETYFFHRIEEA